MAAGSLLLVSDFVPAPRIGSPVVLWRHLQRLEADGWRISVAVPDRPGMEQHLPDSWRVCRLPRWRPGWLPVRRWLPGSWHWRTHLLARCCRPFFDAEPPDALLTILWGKFPPTVAAHLSRRHRVPLSVIVHDLEEVWARSASERRAIRRRAAEVLQQATRVWPVSRELGEALPVADRGKVSVLLPLCGEGGAPAVGWRDELGREPVLVHAGSLHAFQAENFRRVAAALAKVNGRLLVISPERSRRHVASLVRECPRVEWRGEFAQPAELTAFLRMHASAALVSYAFEREAQPWGPTSFASRLLEFTQTGLPVVVFAPVWTATGRWAAEAHWLGHVAEASEAALGQVLQRLRERESWEAMSRQSQEAAATLFHPARIHAQFVRELAVAPRPGREQ